jgi:predicted DNA-binding protein YlxM (UPF0122 family)
MVKLDTDDLITIPNAAKLRGVSHQSIYDLIRRNKMTVTEIDGVKFLKRDEVLNFVKSKGGRPKKKSNDEKSNK